MANSSKRFEGLSDELRGLLETLNAKGLLPTGIAPASSVGTPAESDGPRSPGGALRDETKETFERFYNELGKQLDSTQFGWFSFFLNYGYVADEGPQFSAIEIPKKYINKNSVKLVLEVIGDCDLKDRRILDIGCGRGGSIHVIHEFFQPASITGIDLSSNAIEFCRKAHRYPGTTFREGDAENLPFADSAFDVVINVESSHSYPNVRAFFTEVFRVLAPGGHFLYTDFMQRDKSHERIEMLRNLGFEVEKERDITGNVLLSCDEVAVSRVRAFRSGNDAALMQYFLAVPGSPVYEGMKSRASIYQILKMRKAAFP
jgi:phthiocerol/phenolphthiocerol synthesis type-I polyketide synthase E